MGLRAVLWVGAALSALELPSVRAARADGTAEAVAVSTLASSPLPTSEQMGKGGTSAVCAPGNYCVQYTGCLRRQRQNRSWGLTVVSRPAWASSLEKDGSRMQRTALSMGLEAWKT